MYFSFYFFFSCLFFCLRDEEQPQNSLWPQGTADVCGIGRKEQTLYIKGSGSGFVRWSGTAFSEYESMRPSPTAVSD
jgi:hypothetical protein